MSTAATSQATSEIKATRISDGRGRATFAVVVPAHRDVTEATILAACEPHNYGGTVSPLVTQPDGTRKCQAVVYVD